MANNYYNRFLGIGLILNSRPYYNKSIKPSTWNLYSNKEFNSKSSKPKNNLLERLFSF